MTNSEEKIRNFLSMPKKVVIVSHYSPDADAVGSSLALNFYLTKQGHQVSMISPNSIPESLFWMKDSGRIIDFQKNGSQAHELLEKVEILFCLDFSGYNRLHDMQSIFEKLTCKIALIDHHKNPQIEPDFNFWDDTASSTAELVYQFIKRITPSFSIDYWIAESIYTGIMTDTGSFRYSNTTAKTHEIVAKLIDLGVNPEIISDQVFNQHSISRLKFLGYCLEKKLKLHKNNKVAYFAISRKEYDRYQLKQGDTDGIVNYALSIDGVEVAVMMIERGEELVKLSLRSVGENQVHIFAEKYFGGGGHKNAAGGISKQSLEHTEKKINELLSTYNFKN